MRRRWLMVTCVALFGISAVALAYFTTTGTGTASASVGSINPPSNVTATRSGVNVAISWNAATLLSGASVQGYYVKRSDGNTICGVPTLVTGLSCTDSTATPGTYTYTVTAVYHSIDASATSNSITIGLIAPTLGANPSNPSANTAPSFSFSGGGGSGFQCQLDSGTVTSCTSPQSYSGLSSGSHTFKVQATLNGSSGPTTTYTWTTDTSAPSITSKPSNPVNSGSASFSFTHTQAGYTFKCQLDGGGFAACTSPKTYSALADGSHTFQVEAVASDGSATTPASYTWVVDTAAPTQSLSLAAAPSGAYLQGTTLYYRGNASGSFKLTDTVSDSRSGPASASFPSIGTTGWVHGSETVTTPSGGPYTSSTFSWTTTPTNPSSYTITGADAAGNTTSTALTFVSDTTSPTGGALSVNGTAATAGGSTSTTTNSTSFTINSRTDYSDTGAGLQSSVLTVQSESLSGSTCGALGSGGPFTTATTITGTTQPSGIVAGFCYVYTLRGTDNVGNAASIATTVEDDALSFTVTTQPSSATAGTATTSNAVVLTAVRNGATDTAYTGATLTWGGANTSPSGATPTLPTTPTWASGKATFGITLVKAEVETLTVTDGTRSATFAAITVNTGAASKLAWTSISTTSGAGLPSTCFFACAYASGFGNSKTWTASVSITDTDGNTVSNIGLTGGTTVVVTLGGNMKGSASPLTLTIPSTGPATTTGAVTYTSVSNGSFTDTVTATDLTYTSATASFSK